MNEGMEEKMVEHGLKVMASERAAADALPGPLIGIFENGDIKVVGLTVRKLYAIDEATFKMIGSPIYEMILESAKPEGLRDAVECTTEQEWELILQFTMPPKDAYLLAKQGREAFSLAAMEKIGGMEYIQPKEILVAVMEQITRAFKTKVNYVPDDKGGDAGESVPLTPAHSAVA
jgi:hypothetical protein